MTKYAVSIDDETYYGEYDSVDEAIRENPESIFVGEIVNYTVADFTDSILENIVDSTYDLCGESATDWCDKILDLSEEDKKQFQQMVVDFITEKAGVPTFFTVEDAVRIHDYES